MRMRDIIDLLESADTVTLFRGDSTGVETFDFARTDKSALFGMGIYLTTDPEVANDYTIKGPSSYVYRDDDAKSERELIVSYIHHVIIKKELDWDNYIKEKGRPFSERMWNRDRDDPNAADEIRKDIAVFYNNESKRIVKIAKEMYKKRAASLRVVRETTGTFVLVKADRPAEVSEFAIPRSYLDKTLHGDAPLPDDALACVRKLVQDKFKGNGDFRSGSEEFLPFDQWIEAYKTKGGIRYAWREDRHGGKGLNPSLDMIWNGTHGGFSLFYDEGNQKQFIQDMQAAGYVGIEYDGGVRVASSVRGLGGHRHQAYNFWDVQYINSCRVARRPVQDLDVGEDVIKGLRADRVMK